MKSREPGTLVTARGRDWVVLPGSTPDFVVARPLNGDNEFTTGLFAHEVGEASFPVPTADPGELGDNDSAALLRTALQIGFRGSAGPFRSLAGIAVAPRDYQLVPLLLALRMDPVRLLIGDDVGIGKTIESALIAKELLEQGSATGLSVLCSPALAEQWTAELRNKFALDAVTVLRSTVDRLESRRPRDRDFFAHYPVTVVSTDFIKSEARRDLFVTTAPDLIIVDEAHTCVGGGTRDRQLRYELLKRLARRPQRHLLLVTATPHSGKEQAFRDLIGLLDPSLAGLDLRTRQGRSRLARHFVQRRRHDIRKFLDQRTPFPEKREFLDIAYPLQAEYGRLTREVLSYARESIRTAGGALTRRTRWWSALGLLRSVSSSPAAATATLLNRGGGAASETEADALGRVTVLDDIEDETLEGVDAPPAADDDSLTKQDRARLRRFADAFAALHGPRDDLKLAELIKQVKGLIANGYNPIVFCRYIPTAEYLKTHLGHAFKQRVTVDAVTGQLPPEARAERIAGLTASSGPRILVATDCLSEGVNLQDGFQAVVHYDLAWNPTRHEQREGRVDRFGQQKPIVRAVTLYSTDNVIDPIVLDVLLKKSREIRQTTGVSVPVPERAETVMNALFKEILEGDPDQPFLDLDFTQESQELHEEWQQTAEVEKRWRDGSERESKAITKYAQSGLDLDEIQPEVEAVRRALGSADDVAWFTRRALSALGAHVASAEPDDGGFIAEVNHLPSGARLALGIPAAGEVPPLPFRPHPPVIPGERALVRTDPGVAGLARYVLDAALDPRLDERERPARRAGVIATTAVPSRTTLLLVRYRFHVTMPRRPGDGASPEPKTIVAEDARMLAYRGGERLTAAECRALAAAEPAGNLLPEIVRQNIDRAIREVSGLKDELELRGAEFAAELEEAHRRVRHAAGAYVKGLSVRFQPDADVLGVYVYLPGGAR
ncbi:ATP-dependent helicase HepA [Sphaerisporangium rufum]|uniref:ATP-dependent helicase HepA n=1 Tax=Sphaerisporangium rufum TaxID=1381558 RepID=A0A919UZM2_9ACTN|nr:helicase-related protein [Sphaerisporangium rufum]GII79226.1 ATP-dependent helicase HepA [Sphaerisporangium rufum]